MDAELKKWLQDKAEFLKTELEEFELIASEHFSEEEWQSDYRKDTHILNELTKLINNG